MAGRKKKKKVKKRASLPYAVCVVSCSPVRRRPTDKEEIVTQLLFGECVEVLLKKHNSWMQVRCLWDDYIGWIDTKQVVQVSEEEMNMYDQDPVYSLDLVQSITSFDHAFPILLGSRLPNFDGLHSSIHDEQFVFNGTVICPNKLDSINSELVERVARKFIHAPYLWGGRSVFGIDCSGFTQLVYKLLGSRIPRDASQQVEEGEVIDFLESAQTGDLAFFENDENKITHVGIILDDLQIIHASGQVRIDQLDHQGIYNKSLKKYTHKFRVAKRILKLQEG